MRASAVISPIHRTRNHRVLFESPYSWDEQWSIVEAESSEDGELYTRSLGIRWDGDRKDPDSKGFPNSSGKGVWFWVPKNLEPFFYGIIIPQLMERRVREKNDRVLSKQVAELLSRLEKLQPAEVG